METQALFDMTEGDISKTCRHCKHRQRWQCNSKVFSYCECWKSNRTEIGLKKVRCTDKACGYYEE